MKKIIIPGFLLLFFNQLHAQTWQQLNIPTTSNIESSSFLSDGEGWIGTTNSGSYAIIYHTADGGTSWNADTITDASGGTSFVEFITHDLGFAVVNTKVFKTTDGGDIWTQLTLPDVPYNEPCFINQDTGFISGQYAVFKTVDGGASWTSEYMEETDNEPLYRMTFLNDSIGAAVDGAESVYTTIDGGENWYCLHCGGLWNWYSGLSYNSAGELFITGYYDDGNYVTGYVLGGGEWWGEEGANCYPYDVHFADAYRGYAAGSCGMIVNTTDGALTWTEATISNDEFRVVDGFNDVFVFGLDGKGYRLPYECTVPQAGFITSATGPDVQFTDQSLNASSWFWDFGDGDSSAQQSPSHTYSVEGSFNVCLTVTNSCGSNTSCQIVVVCDPLNTDYLYQVTGLSIQFQNQITEATSFSWDFGDGNTSTQQSPLHNFSSSGTYHVCLVENDACAADTMCKEIMVCGTVAADFNFTASGTMIQFNDASNNALNWTWDFGDGNFSSNQNPSHTYSQAGTYTACLVVSDDCTSDTVCKNIVTGASCDADFTLVADTLNPGFYWGYNLASGENLLYSWTWGDGTSSTGQYPVHLYADSGFYNICEMIYDSIGGCADTFCADYTILKSSGMLEIHEINFVNYAVNVLWQTSDGIEWAVFPNPFSINTTISFIMPASQNISIELFDLSGRKVRMIVNGNFSGKDSHGEEGNHSVQFSKENLSAGIYFLKLKTESETLVKQLIMQ